MNTQFFHCILRFLRATLQFLRTRDSNKDGVSIKEVNQIGLQEKTVKQFYRRALWTLIILSITCGTASAQDSWMPDPNLQLAVREELGLGANDPFTRDDLLKLQRLDPYKYGVKSLKGLEHAKNLTWFSFAENDVSDLSPLSGLMKLETLYGWQNPNLVDITPLVNLTRLKELNLGVCRIRDISALAELRQLEILILYYNHISDIRPLKNLTRLVELRINDNAISDIRPLSGLSRLEILHIQNNRIVSYASLDTSALVDFQYDRSCELPRLPLSERIENRDFPSVFSAWYDILNRPELSYQERMAHHDLSWHPWFGLHFQKTSQGRQLTGNIKDAVAERDALLARNPNMIFIGGVHLREALLEEYPDAAPHYWIKDATGNRVPAAPDYPGFLLDFTHPDVQDLIVEEATEIGKCGLYDGLFIDWWSEDWAILRNYETDEVYRGLSAELEARKQILQRIRAAVGEDFLVIVNPNRRKTPIAAPYINGLFMETVRDHEGGYTRQGLMQIENTLRWAEEKLRSPQVNCLEGWGVEIQAPDSPTNLRWMRVFTTMSLTLSDGYVLYITGIRSPNHKHDWRVFEISHKVMHDRGEIHNHHHDHYWYDFYDADLGRPVSEKAQAYRTPKGKAIKGVFIREFINGWAVYNRSGKERLIQLPEKVSGFASGVENKHWHTIGDLDGEIYLKVVPEPVEKVEKPSDLNADGVVNILDLVILANAFGKDSPDLNADGVVNILDLVVISNAFEK